MVDEVFSQAHFASEAQQSVSDVDNFCLQSQVYYQAVE